MRREHWLFTISAALLAVGGLAWLVHVHKAAVVLWVLATSLGLAVSLATTIKAVTERRPTVDVIALLALAGALAVREPFAGAVITVMLASGQLLEERASARASRTLSALVARSPQQARRYRTSGTTPAAGEAVDSDAGVIEEVPIGAVQVGDRVVVRPGEVVPVDGRLLTPGVFDESSLSGESREVEREAGEPIRSGVITIGSPVELAVTAPAAESTYARLVQLVAEAQRVATPFVRLADRLAVFFVPLTLAVAGSAWAFSGDAVRAVAVLVVATPCPLLLAVPIALISGVSRAAAGGVVVKGAGALEKLARGRTILFDKTGTLTRGQPEIAEISVANRSIDPRHLLRLAAAVEQFSAHVFAAAFARASGRSQLSVPVASDVAEIPGCGVVGVVDGREVRIGKAHWVLNASTPAWARRAQRRAEMDGSSVAFIAVDGRPAGAFLLRDPVRSDAPRMIRTLRKAGLTRIVLLTGDRPDVAESVGRVVGVDAVIADADPADKLVVVREESSVAPTIMVGDGINDAPALAAAGAGVALAGRGATASSEAADVVLVADRIDALADAVLTARRTKRIAGQAAGTGMGLSLAAMAAAGLGLLPPAAGALLQEGIDLLAIALALRALLPGPRHTVGLATADQAVAERLRAEHDVVRSVGQRVRVVADALAPCREDFSALEDLVGELEAVLLPHERAEEDQLLPIVARALRSSDVVAGLSRAHAEIEHYVRRLRRLLTTVGGEPESDDVIEARRLLYGLHAVLDLHNAEEDDIAFALLPDAGQRNTQDQTHVLTSTAPTGVSE